jgi:hypothetical protein
MAAPIKPKNTHSDATDDLAQDFTTSPVDEFGNQLVRPALAPAAPTEGQVAALDNQAIMAAAVASIKTGELQVFDMQLAALYFGQSAQAAAMRPFIDSVDHFAGSVTADGQYVVIDATATDGNGTALLAELQALGLQGGASFGSMASGFMPVSSLQSLLSVSNLAHASESGMVTHAGNVTTQADVAQHADDARATYGVDGTGVKVGIISDSYNRLGGAGAGVASGDLPAAGVQIVQDSGSGTDEGRAMAELVHDVAPGAALAFATANGGQANFATNIVALQAAGAQVIVDDIVYFAELAYQDGIIAQAVDQVTAAGVTYFSSAGNEDQQGYQGNWVSGPTTSTIGTTQGGARTETFMQFAPGQDYLPFNLQFQDTIVLQWNNSSNSASGPSPGPGNDLDFFITNLDGTRIFRQDISVNTNGDAVAIIQFSTLAANQALGTNYLRVGIFSGTAPTEIKIVAFSHALGTVASNTNDGTIYGHAAAAGAVSVAAAAFFETPEFGHNPAELEDFSSAGLVTKWYDVNGNRFASAQVVQAPLITGVDGGNTTFFGTDSAQDADSFPNFFGTSAAAPDVAAVAALMLDANLALTPAQIKAAMYATADDIDIAGVDRFSGAGLIRADEAVEAVTAGSVSIDDVTVSEGNAGTTVMTFTATRSGGTAAFDVNFATANGSATTADGDYVANSGMLSFGTGVNTQTVSVTVNGDVTVEPNEDFVVDLSGATNGATIADSQGLGTITNDDSAPAGSVSIDDVSIAEGNAGTTLMTFTATRSGGTAAFDVNFATADGSATTADGDYVANSGMLSFGTGVNTQTVSVTVNGDTTVEPNEDFVVDLSGATNGATIGDSQGLGTITNDDSAPAGSVSIDDVTVSEGNAGTTVMTFTATRSGGTAAFDVNFATADGSATTADGDYVANSGTLSFGTGVNTQTVSVTVNGDTTVEPNEDFVVDLSGATNGATIGDSQGLGTITNDDSAPAGSVSIDDVTVSEGNAGTTVMTFTATRSGGTAAFDVNFATADGSATTADGDYVANSGTLSFGTGVNTQTVSVTVNGDTTVEPNEDFVVDLSGATNGATIADSQGLGTISNDDSAPATPPVHDFNGDGLSDILWRNDNGQIGEWLMSGASFQPKTVAFITPDWHVADKGDFDGDGSADILWRNDNGQVGLWRMGGNQILSSHSLGFVGNDWQIAGAGDFNGDARSDILWRNDNGQVGVWEMDGPIILSTSTVNEIVGADWHVAGIQDFDGDGKADVLWRNDSGQVGLWRMDDGHRSSHSVDFVGLDWHIEGTGDFDGDGKGDILWRNDSGQVDIWTLDGPNVLSRQTVATVGLDWKIEDTGDYNGDAVTDILWRNDNGNVGEWIMSGADIAGAQTVAIGVTPDWKILGNNYDFV